MTLQPRSALFHEKYSVGKKLGSGTYSIVREGIPITNNEISASFSNIGTTARESYAIKIVPKMSLSREDKIGLKSEVEILHSLKHRNIIQLYAVYRETKFYYLVMEHMKGGELFQRIVEKKRYSEIDAVRICRNLISTIAFIHGNKIAHRDLKPENLLLISRRDDVSVKIADFGFAKRVTSSACLTTRCGSPNYVAPEIISKTPYGTSVDMWSIGVVLYIILCGYLPFADKNYVQLYRKIKQAQFVFHPSFWDIISQDAKDFINALLVSNPKKRLTAKKALNHTWLRPREEEFEAKEDVKINQGTSVSTSLCSINIDDVDFNEEIDVKKTTNDVTEIKSDRDKCIVVNNNNSKENNQNEINIDKPNKNIKLEVDEKSGDTVLLTDSESNRTGSGEDHNNVRPRSKGLQDTIIGRKITVR